MTYMQHPDEEVRQAIIVLCDRLCSWERNTGIESILIIREQGGFVFRAASGKPGIPDDIPDAQLIDLYSSKAPSPTKEAPASTNTLPPEAESGEEE